ncbi:MAG: DUF892 family protein [Methyloceanibacter sp.]
MPPGAAAQPRLKDIYYAEKRIPEGAAGNGEARRFGQPRKAFEHHLMETEGQMDRRGQVFALCNQKPSGTTCPPSMASSRKARTT